MDESLAIPVAGLRRQMPLLTAPDRALTRRG